LTQLFFVQSPSVASKTALVIDDAATSRTMHRMALGRFGYDRAAVTEIQDSVAALNALKAQTYDMVLCDIYLDSLDGLGIMRALRAWEAEQGLPRQVVHCITAADRVTDHQIQAAGFDRILRKPVSVSKIGALLAE
jgi:CheY-like chemotaxis protein